MDRAIAVGLLALPLGACMDAPGGSATSVPFDTSASEGTHEPTASTTTAATTTADADGLGDSTDPGTTTTTDDDTTTGTPACPPLLDPAPAWLPPLQEDLVARLSGVAELSPGVFLSDRATPANRAAALAFLQSTWDDLGLPTTLHAYSATGTNLYATLPATIDTVETVVIGAHFDSVPGSPGANDNATGVAMVTSLGRWLQDLPCRDIDVILVLFDEEELGLLGSHAFATFLADEPLDVLSVHTIDQMGWDADGDRALELERADRGLFALYEAAEPFAPGLTPLIPTNTGFTDHVSFRELGFAAVGLTEEYVSGDTTPHYHLPSDTFETVSLPYLASSTALLHVTIGRLVAPDAQ